MLIRFKSCFSTLLLIINIANVLSLNLCDANSDDLQNESSYYYKNVSSTVCGTCDGLCLRKCCSPGFYIEKQKCVRKFNSRKFDIPLHDKESFIQLYDENDFIVGTMENCNFYLLNKDADPDDAFYVQVNGDLWLPSYQQTQEKSRYCLEFLKNDSLVALVCFPDFQLKLSVRTSGMIISMPFLLVTFIVYAILPDRNLHMKALMCYVINLLFAYIFLVTIQLSDEVIEDTLCGILGFCCVFFFLSSFFWMNVICIDIFLGFRGFRGVPGVRSSERKRFLLYCLYAWGMSFLIVVITFLINTFGNQFQWFYPGVSVGQCFIRNGMPQLLYFYGPMGLIIIFNVVLFTMTALKIRQVKKDTAMLKHSESKRHSDDDQQNFYLYLKLLLAMGVNWTMELISWAVNVNDKSVPQYIWYLSDFCNATYGVFIFFIFVFKRNIWKQLQRRYYSFTGRHHLARSMATTIHTKTTNDSMTMSTNDRVMEESELNTTKVN
ncbi:hypothetical protein HHI36_020594 [Cryptolaemus montrouzieri]|uniref:G-protein coupled receptors family 2 profile 2 domain-containing protein n=1 Tax=Cryptolaemus montrouzieri TaxID=559131 RepID=A0ABD2NAT3_9CUCU